MTRGTTGKIKKGSKGLHRPKPYDMHKHSVAVDQGVEAARESQAKRKLDEVNDLVRQWPGNFVSIKMILDDVEELEYIEGQYGLVRTLVESWDAPGSDLDTFLFLFRYLVIRSSREQLLRDAPITYLASHKQFDTLNQIIKALGIALLGKNIE